MDINNKEEREPGRPRTNDPKMKFDKVRLKTSTILDIELVAEELGVSVSELVQTILDNEMPKYKSLLKI